MKIPQKETVMPVTDQEIKKLHETARQIRHDIIDTTVWAGGAHIGGSMSMVEILTMLYFKYLNIDPKRPDWEDRDRMVLSKGHGGVGYAPVLANRGTSTGRSSRNSTTLCRISACTWTASR
jgi:transketolase